MTNIWIHLVAVALLVAGTATLDAGEPAAGSKMVIALNTDDFDLAETDISDLAIGDAMTIHAENGKTVDLLRVEDGVEIYVDGELIDVGRDGVDGDHVVIHKRIETDCETGTDCEETVWISDDGNMDLEFPQGDGHQKKVIVIRREVGSD